MRLLAAGLGLTASITVASWVVFGRAALVPAITFGVLATIIQLSATALMKPVLDAPFAKFMGRWGVGMGMRLLGVIAFAAAVIVNSELFPPLPAAIGYLGVLLPLLVLETRALR
ncbi:MAG: hypothetical protein ACE5PT_12825 [Gemmatimonadales bacterium]